MNWARILTVLGVIGVLAFVQGKWLKTFSASPKDQAAGTAFKGPAQATETLQGAVKLANSEAKTLVYHFSLENCGPCKMLDDRVLDTKPWLDYSRQNLKVINILFPGQFTDADKQHVKNMELLESICKTTGQSGAFPVIAVFSSEGRVLGAKTGYGGDAAQKYISWIEDLRKQDIHRPIRATAISAPTVAKTNTNAVAAATIKTNPAPATPIAVKPVAAISNVTVQTTNAVTVPVTNAPPESYLALKGLSGGRNAVAMISSVVKNYTLSTGDIVSVQTPSGRIRVKCVLVSGDGAVLEIGEIGATHRLTLNRE